MQSFEDRLDRLERTLDKFVSLMTLDAPNKQPGRLSFTIAGKKLYDEIVHELYLMQAERLERTWPAARNVLSD